MKINILVHWKETQKY